MITLFRSFRAKIMDSNEKLNETGRSWRNVLDSQSPGKIIPPEVSAR